MPIVGRHRPDPTPSRSPARQRLETMIEKLEFGCIERLWIVQREPQFSPRPRCKRVFSLAADDAAPPKRSGTDRRVRTMQALHRRLDAIQGPALADILVQDRAPIRLTVYRPDEC